MKLLLCLASLLWTASAYRILVMTPLPSKSHHHLGKGIVRSLLKANHEVTWVSPFPEKQSVKGLTIVDVSSILDEVSSLDVSGNGWSEVKELTRNISLANLHHPAVRELITHQQFDAIVNEWFMNDIEAGFAAVQQAPWIILSSIVMHPHLEGQVDSVKSVSTIPMVVTRYSVPMTFSERFLNTMIYWVMMLDYWKDSYDREALYKKEFGPLAEARGVELPPLSAAIRNVSIMLVNSHPSIAHTQSLPPNVVDVGGFHIDEDVPPLPKDLQSILDSSKQGAILFSMGSILKMSTLSKSTKEYLINLFSKLPYTIIWKSDEEMKNLPKNVYVRNWLPQNSILAHPNVKIFISHCGLLSTLEALYFGVPMLAIPVFGDQPRNAEDAVSQGRALRVDLAPDMAPKVEEALREMIRNDSYYKTTQHLSRLFKARPVSPSRAVSFYIELAIESRGAFHLRSKALLYSWYEIQNLDVMAAVLLILVVLYLILRTVLRLICRCFRKSNVNLDKKKK
ncbi:UDP-glucosyltransferase 2-like isoform X2 [Aricia agestis]|nr:UDP-glucosyltransferase 2-like isoform X2 [Aricia agestis]